MADLAIASFASGFCPQTKFFCETNYSRDHLVCDVVAKAIRAREKAMHRKVAAAAVVAGVGFFGTTDAFAQNYPDRPIEITVPWTPGAATDVLGRVLADGLASELGQHFIVVNRPGATGSIGSAAVARAAPDGYTLLFTAAVSITVVPLINKKIGYDHQSFDPICQTFKNEMAIVVKPDSPIRTVSDLVNAAKARPGVINYGHLGVGSIPHLAIIEFSQVAGAEFNAIPYKGDADVMQHVLGGQLDFGAVVLSSAVGSGLRILGIFSERRNPGAPDTLTVKEQGFAVAPSSFGGLWGPKGLPASVQQRLSDACKIVTHGERYSKLAASMAQPGDYYADAANFSRSLEKDLADKTPLVAAIGTAN
jgi:tripartite-type tricarboxylate transporter receptor subunit TctC